MLDKKEIKRRLAEGIGIEKKMKETYLHQAEQINIKRIKDALLEIASDESRHEKIVERLWERYGGLEGV